MRRPSSKGEKEDTGMNSLTILFQEGAPTTDLFHLDEFMRVRNHFPEEWGAPDLVFQITQIRVKIAVLLNSGNKISHSEFLNSIFKAATLKNVFRSSASRLNHA